MSASDTNLKKQKRRHRGPLIGITAALVVAAILFLLYLGYVADTDTDEPAGVPDDAAIEEPAVMPAPGTDGERALTPSDPAAPPEAATPDLD